MNFKSIVSLIFIFISFSCSSGNNAGKVDITINKIHLKVEVAATVEERSKGLMFRNSLDKNSGMIFVFDDKRKVAFWMKNTFIPLSIAYIDNSGRILEIHDMTPLSLDSIESTYSNVSYALEVNKGYFKDKKIKVGDYVNLNKVQSYIKSSN